ncbi:hypothetical protein BN1013_01579 [Candidatus Rubidus massiliensis]|nr:MAG: hypothetical protein BGO10_05275 [Chlamydia sp. 32-24]CDZ81051.1 hypothetical protein BN1013_01579 [Candidatus Rubidus massiliensis]
MSDKSTIKNYNQTLLQSLYLFNQEQISPYKNLHAFREKIELKKQSPHHLPYKFEEKKVQLYQTIFCSFGLIFALLSAFVAFYARQFSLLIFHHHFIVPKAFIIFIPTVLSLAAFILMYNLSPQREALRRIMETAKKRMRRAYLKKIAFLSFKKGHNFFQRYTLTSSLRHDYLSSLEKMDDCKAVTAALLKKIDECEETDSSVREHLYNEALLEFNDKIHSVLHQFQNEIEKNYSLE